MAPFRWRDGRLYAEDVSLADVAERHGTPCFVYSRAGIEGRWRAFDDALAGVDHLICYSVKANSNIAVLNLLARLGTGFDIVSVGELERVLAAGGDPGKTVFSGVGKTAAEMARALDAGIRGFNVESMPELDRLNEVARSHGVSARASLRVNPDVDPKTHPYIATGLKENKFGIPIAEASALFERAPDWSAVSLRGVDCHIGSQLTSLAPIVDAMERVLGLVDRLSERGCELESINVGGGLGIRYREEQPPSPADYGCAIRRLVADRPQTLLLEPGRSITGNAGLLLTRVEYLKRAADRNFAIVDAAMNDFLRPTLYGGWSRVRPVVERVSNRAPAVYDVVGPICESADVLARGRELDVQPGDLLAIESAGAYGFSMSSNYNSRPRAAEILVDGKSAHLIRARESTADLFAGETLLPPDRSGSRATE